MKVTKFLISLCFITTLANAEAFKVNDVRVEGLQRITAGSFFNYLPVKRGQTLNDKDFPRIIRELYQTGFFENVNISRDGNILVVKIIERPVIGEIHIDGNKDIKTKELMAGLSNMGLAEGDTFDTVKLAALEKELLNIYYAKSKFDVIVEANTTPLDQNRVALNITIKEGISARIKQINFVGNKAFSEDELLKQLTLTTSKWHSLLTSTDQYSGEKLRGDIDRIESFYLDRGFLDFTINSTQVSLTDDKKYVYITINLTEGLPYRVNKNVFSPSTLVTENELTALLDYNVGSYYSRKNVRSSQEKIKNLLGDMGYAFANVQIVPKIDKTQQDVTLYYSINPGRRAYVRRIEFRGNYKTNDEVLRREMRQMESAVYNHAKIERSGQRLQRLRHITNVKRREVPVAGNPEQIDIVYEITEQPSRSITAGIGYGSSSGFLFNLGYETANFLGTGNTLNFDFNTGDSSTNYAITFTDPYYTVNGVSRTFRLYYNETDQSELDVGDWITDNWGAQIAYGFPINEYESFSIGGGYRGAKVKTGDKVTGEIADYLTQHGDDYNEFILDFNWTHDTRDKTVFSNKGYITRLNAEIVVPGSTETYYKLGARSRAYFPLSNKLILSARGDVSYGDSYGDTSDGLPFFRRYYAGGLTTVRGFKNSSLGPKWSNGDVAGGDFRVTGGGEVIFPWYLGQDEENVRVGAFVDFGSVYEDVSSFDASDFRYSTGLYFLWRSPIGPLNLSYGVPLNDKEGDKVENFQFTIGVPL